MKKGRLEIRLDNELRKEMEAFAELTGKTLTDIVHDAVREHKNSPQLQADIERHRQRQADAASRLRGQKVSKTDTENTILDVVAERVNRGKRSRSRSK
jgi:predicted DNA-binding protein